MINLSRLCLTDGPLSIPPWENLSLQPLIPSESNALPLAVTDKEIAPGLVVDDAPSQPRCKWKDCPHGPFLSVRELGEHIKTEHILPQKRENRKLKMTGSRCYWEGCQRPPDNPFNSFYNLEVHIRFFHTNERPFVCEHVGCNLSFSQQSDLKVLFRCFLFLMNFWGSCFFLFF